MKMLMMDVVGCRRSGYCREDRLRTSADKYYSTPNVVDLPSADELRFYYDDAVATGVSSSSKDAQTILPLTRVSRPSLADCAAAGCRTTPDQTFLTDNSKGDDCPPGMTCVCSSTPGASSAFADCGRHQRTVLLVREHTTTGYDT